MPGSSSFNLRFEKNEGDGSIVFFLRDEVRAAVKFNSPTRVEVWMWRGEDIDTFTSPDVGNIKNANFRRRLARAAARKFGRDFDPETDLGKKRFERLEDDLGQVAATLDKKPEGEGKTLRGILEILFGGASAAELLLKYALVGEYFHDHDGEAFATVPVDDHFETWSLKSRDFKRWLRHRFYSEQKAKQPEEDFEPEPLRSQTVNDVISQLEAKAMFDGPERRVYLRVAESDGKVYIDLCSGVWSSVEIDEAGWRVVPSEATPIKFVRAKGMAALPQPASGNSAGVLRGLLNLKDDDEGKKSWRLILAWLVQALRGRGPYPILVLLGGQGTAKSTVARILRMLIDPSTVPLRTPPKDERDLAIDGVSSWVLAFDNMSTLPQWLSDALCRLATGGGYATRTLYTDRDQELFEAQRPVVLNGITDVATRPDLLDRALIVNLSPIEKEKRRKEAEMLAELEAARPELLGFLFTAISEGLRELPNVEANSLPRMADFAYWARATEEALGAEKGDFMKAYDASQEEATAQALEASPVAEPLWRLATSHKGPENAWVGTATEFLKELAERVDDELKRAKGWPRGPNVLSRELKRLAPPLRDVGIYADQLPRSGSKGSKLWRVYFSPPEEDEKKPSEPSEPSEGGQNPSKTQGFSSDGSSDGTDDPTDDTAGTVRRPSETGGGESPANEGVFEAPDDSDGSDDVLPTDPDEREEGREGETGSEDATLLAAGWKPKDRGENTMWICPENGFAYSREMALKQLEDE